ncbi:MAG: RNA methyltransferase [Beijerinckiaceae bacterium]
MSDPVIVLVRPQMGENIGMAARAMANFGLGELRLVAPRDGWMEGSPVWTAAVDAAVGANAIVRRAALFATVAEAVGDCRKVFATTARDRDQAKPVVTAQEWAEEALTRTGEGQKIGVLFGPERTGLENTEVAVADAILTFPVHPDFSSLNLAQATSLVAYEWWKANMAGESPFRLTHVTPPATRAMTLSFFDYLDDELQNAGYFIPDGKKPIMSRNLRNILHRIEMTEADVRTLRGVVVALAEGRRRRPK